MNLRILGYSGGYPGAGVPTSGYLLTIGNKNILIDCGSGVLAELQKYLSVECLDMIILTHLHHDHTSDLPVLRYALNMKSKRGQTILPIPVYAPKTPTEAYEGLENDPFLPVSVIDSSVSICLAEALITFHPTSHSAECYGIRVEHNGAVYSYSSDSAFEPLLFEFLRESDLSILDCGGLSADDDPDRKHMTPDNCFYLYTDFHMKRVVLSHLIPYHSVSDTISEASALGPWPFEIAEMGKIYIIES
ncbi:MAG: MBL fold metallo-hydrolase [Oscillospiraceae bacterium]|jgi:ribonuclease BN (tRNA processing enzyme)|nr:MBL fold metallo-hydrolase [Oscillospiraceae bacterium]